MHDSCSNATVVVYCVRALALESNIAATLQELLLVVGALDGELASYSSSN